MVLHLLFLLATGYDQGLSFMMASLFFALSPCSPLFFFLHVNWYMIVRNAQDYQHQLASSKLDITHVLCTYIWGWFCALHHTEICFVLLFFFFFPIYLLEFTAQYLIHISRIRIMWLSSCIVQSSSDLYSIGYEPRVRSKLVYLTIYAFHAATHTHTVPRTRDKGTPNRPFSLPYLNSSKNAQKA